MRWRRRWCEQVGRWTLYGTGHRTDETVAGKKVNEKKYLVIFQVKNNALFARENQEMKPGDLPHLPSPQVRRSGYV